MNNSKNPMHLPAGWYVIGSPQEWKVGVPHAIRRMGRNWVLWKNAGGRWVLQDDRCPHRSARLSLGHIHNDCVVCPFHGFEFDSTGACTHAPEISRDAPGVRVETHLLKEEHGFLWLKWGDIPDDLHWFEDLPGTWEGSQTTKNWRQHISRCVENQLDYAHLKFVHSKTIGKKSDPAKKPHFEKSPIGMRVIFDDQKESDVGFEFRYPNFWRLRIASRFMLTLCFVPIDAQETRMYLRAYQDFVKIPGLRWLVGWSSRYMNQKILAEDHRVVIDQVPSDVREAEELEHLFPSDMAIREYRRWLAGDPPLEKKQ